MFEVDFSVRVVYYHGDEEKPYENATVYVSDSKHVWSTSSWEDTTDEDGVVNFTGEWMHGDGRVHIFVNGDDYGEYEVSHDSQITINYNFD